MSEQKNIFSILNNIYSTNGKNKNYWKDLLVSIKNDSSFPGIIEYFNQRIKNEPSNILNLDILDFLIDYGHINLLRELSKNDLMMNVFTLLRKSSGSGPEVQKKGIYLTKKWYDKASNKKENFEGFIKNYIDLQSKGIVFPPSGFKLNTYEEYISINDINNLLSNINFFHSQDNNENDFNNNYENVENKNINIINQNFKLDNNSTPFEGDSKYNNNNDDLPSNDIPELNKFENFTNLDLMKTLDNDTLLANKNDKLNFEDDNKNNNDFNNNISKENYLDKKNKKEKEEGGNTNFVNPFIDEQNQLNQQDNPFNNKPGEFNPYNENIEQELETSNYPDYNEKEINDNYKYQKEKIGKNSNNNGPKFNSTPYGNKNDNMPKENKSYKTVYNCGFKSYMDEKYGIKNNNNNTFNNNMYNNNVNNYYNDQGNNYNNNSFQNNHMQINQNNNNMNEPGNATFLYKHSWVLKISLYNQWMNHGSNNLNLPQLRSGIKTILNEFGKIESLLQKYNREGDFESVSIILKLRSDMNQTCYRFEKFINKQPYENFYSAFDGNNKVYSFNKEYILCYIESTEKNNNKYVEGLKKIGGVMKKGIVTAGKVVREKTVKGINFVKEKVHNLNNDYYDYNNNSRNINRYNYNNNVNDFSHSSDNYYNQNYYNYNNQNNNFNNMNNYNNSFNNQQNNYNNQFNNFNNNQNNNYNRNYY